MGNNKFWKGVCWGALLGGAVSLLDRQTRKEVANTGRKVGEAMRNPRPTVHKVKSIVKDIQEAYGNIRDDVTYISDKLYELKDVPTKVSDIISESKKVVEGKGETPENQSNIPLNPGRHEKHTDPFK